MIHVLDYGMGNLHSVENQISNLGASFLRVSNPTDLDSASGIILPGVGHFGHAMQQLKELNLIEPLHKIFSEGRIPILGICLGMQLMAKQSEEGDCAGLGWLDAQVIRLQPLSEGTTKLKVPHIGWNTIDLKKASPLMAGIDENDEFYFVHAYHMQCNNREDILSISSYGCEIVSSIQKKLTFAVQFHPEKSHQSGRKILKNFLSISSQ